MRKADVPAAIYSAKRRKTTGTLPTERPDQQRRMTLTIRRQPRHPHPLTPRADQAAVEEVGDAAASGPSTLTRLAESNSKLLPPRLTSRTTNSSPV